MSERFEREKRLTRRIEFRQAYSDGKSYATPFFVCHVRPTGLTEHPTRLGLSASKRIGGACVRNRCKRWAREVFRRQRLQNGRDVVISFRSAIATAKFEQFASALVRVFERARLYES